MALNGEEWATPQSECSQHVEKLSRQCLAAYRENPPLVREHANIERAVFEGGYEHRQIYELVQNGADEMLGSPGRVEVVLTPDSLYCANEGSPLTKSGIEALLGSNLSTKRGFEIGRFGVGFKSVLRISDSPLLVSKTCSFRFSKGRSRELISAVVPDLDRYPILRVAEPVDPRQISNTDIVLAELMSWATTVIRLPLLRDTGEWLSKDLSNFPAEFVLFAQHVSCLVLDDRIQAARREISQRAVGDSIELTERNNKSTWKIFRISYSPSIQARQEAGELADREVLPLHWAVPLEGRTGRGQFWAFFPTSLETGVSGILNAPWKTNVDRQYLLDSKINRELIARAAILVVESLPQLVKSADPGWILGVLPGRIDESPPWADRFLNTSIYERAKEGESIPDQLGIPRRPADLNCTPAHLPEEAYAAWAELPDRPPNWPHPSCESRERRSRMDRLFGTRTQPASIVTWLESLAKRGRPKDSIAALKVAYLVWRLVETPAIREQIRAANIVLTSTGQLVCATPAKLFLPSVSTADSTRDLSFVHSDVAQDPATSDFLREIGITECDETSSYKRFIADGFGKFGDREWQGFWTFAKVMPSEVAASLESRDDLDHILLRTCSGKFRPRRNVLLPGPIADTDGDQEVAVDIKYHAGCESVLAVLNIHDRPTSNGGTLDEPWGAKYQSDAVSRFYEALPPGQAKPRSANIGVERKKCVGPLEPIYGLSDDGKARFTEHLLAFNEPGWTVTNLSKSAHIPVKIEPPSVWMIRRQGRLKTSLGILAVDECVNHELRKYHQLLPVIDATINATVLELATSLSELTPQQMKKALHEIGSAQDVHIVGQFYADLCDYVAAPDHLYCNIGSFLEKRPREKVAVVWTESNERALADSKIPFIPVESNTDAQRLISKWGLLPGDNLLRTTVAAVPASTERAVTEYFPALRGCDGTIEAAVLSPCTELRLETLSSEGKQSRSVEFYSDGTTIYYLVPIDDRDLLDRIDSQFLLKLSDTDKSEILTHRRRDQLQQRLAKIRSAPSLASKLAKTLGADRIRKHLPIGLAEAVGTEKGTLTADQMAELAFAVYGVDVLKEFNAELADLGLEPPNRWASSNQAIEFVSSLGFPKEFAGFESARREALLQIEGPPRLPELHDYQKQIASKFKSVATGQGFSRGLLCLPTGAGKTRVAVQALIESMVESKLKSPVICWIAQSDELCEQAVQSWSECWRAFGDRRVLSISRLWSTNAAHPTDNKPHVVVATIQKLSSCVSDPSYQWLTTCGCIVVDEAHGAITPEYTKVLKILGIDFTSREHRQDRCPLIGLTATPFRGDSEIETERLVGRFGRNRIDLDVLGDDPYGVLQERGVLARVDHMLINGTEIRLTASEESEFRRFRKLPPSVEERLGKDISRNKSLLESIASLPSKVGGSWTAIVFATSVQHAQIMAAMLNFEGIQSASISSETDAGARRHYIEQFREGKIRVLTNYGVLTQGFDAPSVRAIYVARPTFSPNLYQQMIGRGLRGPKNGGKERCLIVNVRDNVERYGVQLAFQHFDYLWKAAD